MSTPYASFTGRIWLKANIAICGWQVHRANMRMIRSGQVGWWDDWRHWKDVQSWWLDRRGELGKADDAIKSGRAKEHEAI